MLTIKSIIFHRSDLYFFRPTVHNDFISAQTKPKMRINGNVKHPSGCSICVIKNSKGMLSLTRNE